MWDDSPLQLKQIEHIGLVAVRKLINAGVKSIEQLECMEPHRIEMAMEKNPPFGVKLLDKVRGFPRPRVSLKIIGKPVSCTW